MTPGIGPEMTAAALRLVFLRPTGGVLEEPGAFKQAIRLCVSARLADADEVRSYRAWRLSKGDS